MVTMSRHHLDKFLFEKFKKLDGAEEEIIESLIVNDFVSVISHPAVNELLQKYARRFDKSAFASGGGEDAHLHLLFCSGIAALQSFVVANFTGPPLIQQQVKEFVDLLDELFKQNPNLLLDFDVQHPYHVVNHLALLKFSILVFELSEISEIYSEADSLLFQLWNLRLNMVHQLIIDSLESSLFDQVKSCTSNLCSSIKNMHPAEGFPDSLVAQLYIEMSTCHSFFGDVESANLYLKEAQELVGLDVTLTGALGLRTHFQQKPVSQLMVKIKRNPNLEISSLNASDEIELPKNLSLSDDTLLPKIKFLSEEEESNATQLLPIEQLLLLAIVYNKHRHGPVDDELWREELLALLDVLISSSTIWGVSCKALFLRCLIEKFSSRRIDRSMTQMNELFDVVKITGKNHTPTCQRLEMFYASLPSPVWIIEKQFAELLTALGAVKSALDVYLRLQLWDQVILCYKHIGRYAKAAELIEERLAVEETPYLYCLLGDVTGNIEHYKKAWELSKHKYARAQKSLGNYYFERKVYRESIQHFNKSLELNSMQTDVLYSLGFATLQVEDYEQSAQAYRKVLQLESSFVAWNNLSKVYIKMKQKKRAWKTLQEALKLNYDEWKIWQNYMVVSIDVGAFNEVIQAWHRIIDLKGNFQDDQLLEILVGAICSDIGDINQEPASKHTSKMRELFGRITSIGSCSSKCWKLYAKLLKSIQVPDYEKIVWCYQKCHQVAVQNVKWSNEATTILEMLQHVDQLVGDYQFCADNIQNEERRKQILASCKMSVNSVIVNVERQKILWDTENCDKREEIDSLLTKCKEKLDYVDEK